MKWYKVSWVVKRGGYQSAYCYLQAENAKSARERFDRIAYKIDQKKTQYGLKPAHRFQIKVSLVNANIVNLSEVWKESGEQNAEN